MLHVLHYMRFSSKVYFVAQQFSLLTLDQSIDFPFFVTFLLLRKKTNSNHAPPRLVPAPSTHRVRPLDTDIPRIPSPTNDAPLQAGDTP